MSLVSQVSCEKQVKDTDDVIKKGVPNEAEDSGIARKRRIQEVNNDDSDSQNGSSVIQAKKPKVDSPNFKGVLLLGNEHWGAQIYIKLKRVWLGTFPSEKEAAMAYDSASIKVHSSSLSNVAPHRNIPLTNITVHEPAFQEQFNLLAVITMIREGSYLSKFYDYLKEHSLVGLKPSIHKNGECGFFCKSLFEKVLTPSDVSSLNRLVIPKKYATMHLHGVADHHEGEGEGDGVGGGQSTDSEVVCYDRQNDEWKFRFCYWKSSQSFVFTRGWNAFIKAKDLKAKDTILFFTCQCPSDKTNANVAMFGIDVRRSNNDEPNNANVAKFGVDVRRCDNKDEQNKKLEKDVSSMDSNGSGKQSLKLFGKVINV